MEYPLSYYLYPLYYKPKLSTKYSIRIYFKDCCLKACLIHLRNSKNSRVRLSFRTSSSSWPNEGLHSITDISEWVCPKLNLCNLLRKDRRWRNIPASSPFHWCDCIRSVGHLPLRLRFSSPNVLPKTIVLARSLIPVLQWLFVRQIVLYKSGAMWGVLRSRFFCIALRVSSICFNRFWRCSISDSFFLENSAIARSASTASNRSFSIASEESASIESHGVLRLRSLEDCIPCAISDCRALCASICLLRPFWLSGRVSVFNQELYLGSRLSLLRTRYVLLELSAFDSGSTCRIGWWTDSSSSWDHQKQNWLAQMERLILRRLLPWSNSRLERSAARWSLWFDLFVYARARRCFNCDRPANCHLYLWADTSERRDQPRTHVETIHMGIHALDL